MKKTCKNTLNSTTLMVNKILITLLYFCLISIVIGAFGKLPLNIPNINIYFIDLTVGGILIVWILNLYKLIKLIKDDKLSSYFLLFVIIGFFSLIFSPLNLSWLEKIISSFYLLRFFSYYIVYITIIYLVKTKTLLPKILILYLGLAGFILAVVSWLQYLLYPDLRNLYYLGWDPHYKRIFGSFFDPNYLGLILVLALIALFSTKSTYFIWFCRIIVFITITFTYSRSSFLSLFIASFVYSVVRRKYFILILISLVFILTIFILPRPKGEGVKLARTFSLISRIENWRQGYNIFLKTPILGVGFNALRYAKKQYGFAAISQDESHSGAGFDNSFIVVLATTGIVGLIAYVLFLAKCFGRVSLFVQISLAAIIAHSFFLNSLFFPWVMVWMWITIGIGKAV